ncbi:MAG: hypothetical protein JSV05_04270 [Candidatus Bathyarchaeota archaeon]|nr:MAG: hypothetical protein JSV05_04270 [Candidatus Bathyarchaeota archaeon]
MPKKAVIITVLLLLVLAESAIAIPKTKPPKPDHPIIEITFTESATLGAGNVYLGNQQIDAGILYVQDAISTGSIGNGDSPISGFEILTSLSGTLDLNTYLGSYYGEWIITGEGGTFEGSINGKVAVATISGRFVGQGTGDFEGHKIKGTFEGSINNYQIEMTIHATITSKAN